MSKIKLDKSMLEIDPVKMLLFFLAFVAISLLIIFALIVPSVREYKKVKTKHSRYEMSVKRMENTVNAKDSELKNIMKDNSKVLDALISRFDKQDFISYADKFFQNVKLSEIKNRKIKDGFTLYELNVTSSIKTPNNFYDFLDGLAKYKNIVKIDYPITMQSKDENIEASFNVKVYRTDDIN